MNKASAAATAALVVVALGVGKSAAADQAAAPAPSLQPGQWEMVTQVTTIEIPGAPPEMQAQIRRQAGQSQASQECMTAERARNPIADMQRMISQDGAAACRFTDQVFSGGVIRVGATCPAPGGQGSAQVSMEGSFTATTMQVTLNINAQDANPAMPGATGMRIAAQLNGRRVGECPASPAPPATQEPVPLSPSPPTP